MVEYNKASMEQYKFYLDLLRQTSLQRTISNYFFIAVNVAIILGGYVAFPKSLSQVLLFAILSVIGIVISFYWNNELRESYIVNEVRYRAIMEFENKHFKDGILNEEWQNLGDFKFRRTPVIFVSIGKILPILFIMLHIFVLFLFAYSFFIES